MRCFIAAWPDAATRLALAALADDVRQRIEHRRASRVEDLHLTLAFIGEMPSEGAPTLAAAIAKMRFSPFVLRLDRLGFFAEAGVVWIGGSNAMTQPLVQLAGRARAVLDTMNIEYDARPLAPHVTLLRGVKRCDVASVVPIDWRVDSIALYRSAPQSAGSRYTRVIAQ